MKFGMQILLFGRRDKTLQRVGDVRDQGLGFKGGEFSGGNLVYTKLEVEWSWRAQTLY